MPNYIVKSNCIVNNKCNDNICKDTSRFFDKLATKLLVMTKSINKRIEDIKKQVCETKGNGALLASIDTPEMIISIKYEYIEYIKRYGPPINGIFEESKLNIIKKELGITSENTL